MPYFPKQLQRGRRKIHQTNNTKEGWGDQTTTSIQSK